MKFLEFGGVCFLMGDVAAGVGAILAGCDFFAGYPITPASEIMEFMAEELPKRGGVFIQMEDEIGSIAAIIGASWAGRKAMTATSGPGYSLMQENIGYAYMTETPIVVINVQRAGPSTGQATMPAQGDVMQSRFGTHGDYESVVFAPNSPQEMLDLTIKAFNTAEMLRTPVTVLSDEIVGHLRERVEIPEKVKIVNRKTHPLGHRIEYPFKADEDDLVPKFPMFGKGHRVHVTGLSHSETGYPVESAYEHSKLIRRLFEKIRKRTRELFDYEVINESSKVKIVSYGCVSRTARLIAEKRGVGLIRLKTLNPIDEELLGDLIQDSYVLVPEMNMGQLFYDIKRIGLEYGALEVRPFNKIGGDPIYPNEIEEAIKQWL